MTSGATEAGAGQPAEVTGYVAAVREALADLPAHTRDELLEDLPEHLTEVLADGGGPLTDRLGTPERYAAELRAAAGAGATGARRPAAATQLTALAQRWRGRLRVLDTRVGPVIGYASVTEFVRLLRPAWWVLRGYLAAMLVVGLLDGHPERVGLLPRLGGSDLAALVILAGFVAVSIWLGRRPRHLAPWPRYALRSGTVLLVLVALFGFLDVDSRTRRDNYGEVYYDNNPFGHVEDVYVYDAEGRPVRDARLFDQDGRPIQLGYSRCAPPEQEPPWPPGFGQTYPHCPDLAPFGGPLTPYRPGASPSPGEPVEPAEPGEPGEPGSGDGAPSATPGEPTVTSRPSTAASARPSPSAAVTSSTVVPSMSPVPR